MREYILWGAKGQARVVHEILREQGLQLAAVFDNDPDVSNFAGQDVGRGEEAFDRWHAGRNEAFGFVVCIGSNQQARVQISDWLANRGGQPVDVVHPTAYVSPSATVGRGCQLLMGSRVGTNARLGELTIVNSGASVDHDCAVGRGVHLCPGAVLCGEVTIGDETLIGAAAVVRGKRSVGRSCTIGMGAVVTKDFPDGVTAWGNPAREQA